jgi:nitrogen regulatory protein P-II 1
MKKINALIRPLQWEDARAALETLGVSATLREVRSFGHIPARREVYRGSAYFLDTATELELTMLVQDELLESTLTALEGATIDAEIVVTSVERVIGGKRPDTARPVTMLRAAMPERPIATVAALSAARA